MIEDAFSVIVLLVLLGVIAYFMFRPHSKYPSIDPLAADHFGYNDGIIKLSWQLHNAPDISIDNRKAYWIKGFGDAVATQITTSRDLEVSAYFQIVDPWELDKRSRS